MVFHAFTSQFFQNLFASDCVCEQPEQKHFMGIVFLFVSTFSLGEVPEKITEAVSRG